MLDTPGRNRGCRTQRPLQQIRVVAENRIVIRTRIDEQDERAMGGRLEDFGLQTAHAGGRLPMDAARIVAGNVVSHPNDAQRILQERVWRHAVAKGRASRQAQPLKWYHQRVHQKALGHVFALLLTGEQAKGVTAFKTEWAKGVEAPRNAAQPIAAGHALEGPK